MYLYLLRGSDKTFEQCGIRQKGLASHDLSRQGRRKDVEDDMVGLIIIR